MKYTRAMLAVIVALTMPAGATACSSSDPTETPTGAAPTSTGAPFPVTIEHRYGRTEIKESPERVVSLGYTDQDALLALGVTPVSVHYWDGMTPEGQAAGNWAKDLIEGEAPRIDKDDPVNVEAIAKDDPDLIVAVYSDIDEATYDKLSKIAPVVVQKGDYKELQQPWDVSTEEIGQAVGKSAEAAALVQGVKDKFAKLKAKHPEWADKTLGVVSTDEQSLYVFSADDPRSRFFTELGFKINPDYKAITGDKFYGEVSKENADQVNSDVIIWDQLSYSPKQDRTSVTDDPILSKIPAVAENKTVYLEGDLEKAFGWQTVLSLDYLLDNIEPLLVEAQK